MSFSLFKEKNLYKKNSFFPCTNLKPKSWFPLGLALFGITYVSPWKNVSAAEPMMDSGIYGISRMQATNQVNDGRFREAILDEEKALRIAQDHLGPVHPSLVFIFNDLASLHEYLAEYRSAEEDIKWGLALREKTFGVADLRVADSKERLAALYNDLGRFQEAEILQKQSLAILQDNADSASITLTQALNLLGIIESHLNHYDLAQTLFERAFDIQNKNSHSDPGLSIQFQKNMAQTYWREGLITKAKSSLEGILEYAQKNFTANDIHVADSLVNLGDFYHSQNQDEKAKTFYDAAFSIEKPMVGTYMEYPALPYMKRLAKMYLVLGNTQTSEILWQKSLQTEIKVLGPRHPQVALDLNQLAQVEWLREEKSTARKNAQESLEILKSCFPDDHPLVLEAQDQLEKLRK